MISTRVAALLFVLSILLLIASQLMIKWRFNALGLQGEQGHGLWLTVRHAVVDIGLWTAGLLVLAGAAMWYAAMTKLPLSFMLPAAAIVSPLVALGAHVTLGERVTTAEFVLIGLIAILVGAFGLIQAQK